MAPPSSAVVASEAAIDRILMRISLGRRPPDATLLPLPFARTWPEVADPREILELFDGWTHERAAATRMQRAACGHAPRFPGGRPGPGATGTTTSFLRRNHGVQGGLNRAYRRAPTTSRPAASKAASSWAARFSYEPRDQRPENRSAAAVTAGTRRVCTVVSTG